MALARMKEIDNRRAPRDLVSFRATLERGDGLRGQLLMVDISPFGFMSRTATTLAPGDMVSVKLPALGQRSARVVWALAGRVGGEFLEPISAHGYARLLASAPYDRPAWDGY